MSQGKAARGWHSRGYLPHFDGGELTQAVTIRLADSFATERLDAWRQELVSLPAERARSLLRSRIDEYLDAGHGECWLRTHDVAQSVQDALLFFDGNRYSIHGWVVMPNHVHALFTPRSGFSLSGIMFSWKSFTSKAANRILQRGGQFWQEDYFDRYIRDEAHYYAELEYIENNPISAGLCSRKEDWLFSSASALADNKWVSAYVRPAPYE